MTRHWPFATSLALGLAAAALFPLLAGDYADTMRIFVEPR